eukprot:scaffold128414_cov63-Phaeocystis_antarctica.AAC.3
MSTALVTPYALNFENTSRKLPPSSAAPSLPPAASSSATAVLPLRPTRMVGSPRASNALLMLPSSAPMNACSAQPTRART